MRLFSVIMLALLPLPAQDLPEGKTLLEREAGALKSYVTYQYTEDVTTQVTVMGNPVSVPTTMEMQVVNPNKIRMEMKTGNVTTSLLISDGETTWMYIPVLKQYSRFPANEQAQSSLFPQLTGNEARNVASAVTKRSETVEVDGAPHDCWVVESRVAKSSMGGMEIQDAVYLTWVDKITGITLQRNMSGKMQGGPIPGPAEMQTKSFKHTLKFNDALPDSLFTFVPPADAKETNFADAPAAGTLGLRSPGPASAPRSQQAPQSSAPRPTTSQTTEPEAYVPFLNPTHREEADWPEAAKQNGQQGMVEILVTVRPDGLVSKAEVLSGPEIFRKPAVMAVEQWKFRPVLRDGRAVFAYTEATVDFIDFSKPNVAGAGLDLGQEMAAQTRLMEIQSRFPRSPEQVLADLEQDITGRNGPERDAALPQLAKAALTAGALDKAGQYANELLSTGASGGWNEGNAVHDGNIVRGLVALRSGSIQLAAQDLIEAGKTKGSPQLNSFGPNMTLARELLEKGERDTVVEYLTLCKKFWTMGSSRLDQWITTIRAGGTPDFGANLIY
jgi:TonB family protein